MRLRSLALLGCLVPNLAWALPSRSQDFLNSLGVGVHFSITTGAYGDLPSIASALYYEGFNHVRFDMTQTTSILQRAVEVGFLGYKYDLILYDTPQNYGANWTLIEPYLDEVEGPNEPDVNSFIYNGQSPGVPSAAYLQPLLWTGIQIAAPSLPVLTFATGANSNSEIGVSGNLSSSVTYGNYHFYPGHEIPSDGLAAGISKITNVPGKSLICTETGYSTVVWNLTNNYAPAVSETAQARYEMSGIYDHFQIGDKRTYLYELADEQPDPSNLNGEYHYGLFRSNWTPKPIASEINATHSILLDLGATATSFTPSNLSYTLSGSGYQSLVFEKSNGRYYVVIWAEPIIWNGTTHQDIPDTSPISVQLTLSSSVSTINLYDPLIYGTSPWQRVSNSITLTASLLDHPLIFEIIP